MNNVAQSAHEGPSVNSTGIEGAHERRIIARIAKERGELAADAQVYREIANEVEGGPLSAQRLVVVLASAIGAFPGNPLTAIIEEIGRRCTTLALTARAGHSADGICPGDVLEALEPELQMLEARASAAGELLRRFGDPCDTLREPHPANEEGQTGAPTIKVVEGEGGPGVVPLDVLTGGLDSIRGEVQDLFRACSILFSRAGADDYVKRAMSEAREAYSNANEYLVNLEESLLDYAQSSEENDGEGEEAAPTSGTSPTQGEG